MSTPANPITLLAADDHPLLLEGLAAVIACEPDLRLLAEAHDGAEAVALYLAHRPDVVLMDIQMPGLDGIAATREIRRLNPAARVVVLTTYQGDALALKAIQAGAAGYLLKSALRRELVDIVRLVHSGRRLIPPEIVLELATHLQADRLSEREVEVLALAASGRSNKRIADRLALSEETVKVHMKNILAKMAAHDRTHAVTLAYKRGILDIDHCNRLS
ncbi:response regulator transcription factor [Chitinimonas sp.]|uniref:response regulator transcription factor n=1 Tax=Chitinimonas sp. TaxID=1934313 RepID=UPI002F91C3AE